MRGDFDFFTDKKVYKDSEKDWLVELSRANCFWFDLIVNPPKEANTNKSIISYLKELKKEIDAQLEKRFIYFIAARKKVRFSEKRRPKYSLFDSSLIIWFEVGKQRKLIKRRIRTYDLDPERVIKPDVTVSERFITFSFSKDKSISFSIHDFMSTCRIQLGIDTEIHYVGITEDPSKRPFNRIHRGLTDMMATVSNEDNDFFVFVNLFKVTVIAKNEEYGINFNLANPMIDEVKANEEGQVIEKSLIYYFKTKIQEDNEVIETSELANRLKKLATVCKIKSVGISMESEIADEYYRFCSRVVKPAFKHEFTCKIENDSVKLINKSTVLDDLLKLEKQQNV